MLIIQGLRTKCVALPQNSWECSSLSLINLLLIFFLALRNMPHPYS